MATFAEGRNEEALLAELLGDGGDRRAYLIGCRLASDINCCIPAAERNTMYGQLYELMGKYGLAIGLELSHDRSKTAMDLLRKLRKDFSHPHQGNTTVNFTRRGNLRNKEEHGSNENDGNKSVRDGTNVQSSGVDECIRQAHSARISQALGCPEVSPRSQPSKDTYQFVVSQLNFKNRARAYEIFVLGGPECLDGVFRLLLQHKTSDQTSMVATARHLSEWIGARVADMGGVRALELAALMSLAADNKRILSKENCVAEKHGSVNGPGPVWWVHLGFHIVERSALLHQLEYIGGIQSREVGLELSVKATLQSRDKQNERNQLYGQLLKLAGYEGLMIGTRLAEDIEFWRKYDVALEDVDKGADGDTTSNAGHFKGSAAKFSVPAKRLLRRIESVGGRALYQQLEELLLGL